MFLVGQKVKWSSGNMKCKGLFLQTLDEKYSEVMMYEVNHKVSRVKMKVLTNILQLDRG